MVSNRQQSLERMPLKQTTESNDVLCDFDPTVSADECKLCCHFDQQCKSGRPYKRKQFAEYIASCLGIFDHQWCTFLRDHTNWKWPILNGFWIKCSHKCCLFRTPVSVILIFCFYQLIVDASKPMYAQSWVCKQFRCCQNGVNCMARSFSPVFPVWHWHLECRLTKHV